IGRKKVILTGCLLASLTLFPVFRGITHFANPALESASANNPVTLRVPSHGCSVQIDLFGNKPAVGDCDKLKAAMAKSGVPYTYIVDPTADKPAVRIGTSTLVNFDFPSLISKLQAA